MWQFLLHLWESPPVDLRLTCPAPATGQSANAQGFYDYTSVAATFNLAAIVSVIVVLLGVVICYQWTRGSLGGRFVKRWWIALALTGVFCFVAAWSVLATFPTTALANSCASNPDAFAARLPTALILNRAFAGLVWGWTAYVLLSLVATATIGRLLPHRSNGFFHYRGCPWPRVLP